MVAIGLMAQPAATDYVIPRNPAIPSPSLGDVMSSPPLERDDNGLPGGVRVQAFVGDELPPRQASLVDLGTLLPFELGLLFVASTGDVGWREIFQEVKHLAAPMATGLGADLVLPVEGAVARALRKSAADEFVREMKGRDAQQARRQDLERRLEAGRAIVLPYVDLVRTRSARVRSGLRKQDCTAVTLESSTGAARTVCLKGIDATFSGRCLARRFEQEFLHVAGAVWDELLDQQELWASLARRYPDLSAVPVGRVWDDWKAAVGARLAARTLTEVQVTTVALHRLGPWLDHFRRVPSARQAVEAAEGLVRGSAPVLP